MAGFSSSSKSNLAVYWGQNSYGQSTGPYTQQRLSYYCSNTDVDIIPLAFMNLINQPTVNFANAGNNCTLFAGSTLLDCPQIEQDIQTCQKTYGKTIMLSIGGATYTEGGFSSPSAAVAAADSIWAIFGPASSTTGGGSVNRPFGNAVVDGFDFDFESSTSNMAPFASELRAKMDAATAAGDKTYYLSAAPQCPYPDVADNDMLNGAVYFDFVMVQFYNNYCGLQSFVPGAPTQNNFNFATWDNWAKTVSKNPNVRVLLGVPASATAAGSGYVSGPALASVISYAKQYSSFGGVMMWDMSQAYANTGFLDQVAADLASNPSVTTTTTRTTTTPATLRPPTQTTKTGPSTLITVTTTAVTCGVVSTQTKTVTVSTTVTVTASTTTKPGGKTTQTTLTTVTTPSSPTGPAKVGQWGQCGGIGYTGSTQCVAPYRCVLLSAWWSQCE
ncbi:aminotransferase class 3 [Niveomyces insectorum RCEF 264]|uniref:chitinase n=1 Tax=Niveomyces insectorum RCEF 264 TaxID=1081102 RepID=A0A162MQ79_9HYPO|nr:aminotransferase class 3 [Niveomyces insectorum RCEF 264]